MTNNVVLFRRLTVVRHVSRLPDFVVNDALWSALRLRNVSGHVNVALMQKLHLRFKFRLFRVDFVKSGPNALDGSLPYLGRDN